jgi:hypothetical protein
VHSVADLFRAESRGANARLTAAERLQLALALGMEDVMLLSAARGVPPEDAIASIRRTRQYRRRRSAAEGGTG